MVVPKAMLVGATAVFIVRVGFIMVVGMGVCAALMRVAMGRIVRVGAFMVFRRAGGRMGRLAGRLGH